MKKFCICISTFIRHEQDLKNLMECLFSVIQNVKDSFDIFILNDSHDKKEIIIKEVKENNLNSVTVVNTRNKGTAYIYIFQQVQSLGNDYEYYINLHDTTHFLSPLPELTEDYYHIWSLGKGWKLDEIYQSLCKSIGEKINFDFDYEKIKESAETKFGLYWFMFGCMFIMKRKYIDLIYNTNFKNIYSIELSRWDRIGLEVYLGYLCHTLFLTPTTSNSIEPRPWPDAVKKEENIFIFEYFKKISFGR